MATHIEDIVQNIYTNCDTRGFAKLIASQKKALEMNKELQASFNALHQEEKAQLNYNSKALNHSKLLYLSKSQQIRLNEQEVKSKKRLQEYEEKWANRKKRRDEAELKRQRMLANPLGSMFRRAIGAYIGIHTLRDTISTARELDLIQKGIVGLTGSTQDWDYVQREAFRTGTDIGATAKGYRNFYSSATMAGFNRGEVQSMYSDVLTASRAIGASQIQTSNALLALEQMLSKGKISMEELRRQLGNALPGAFEIGARAMGVTTEKFNEMVKEGLKANDFVPKFTKELLKTYEKGFPDAIKSLDFALVNLSTSWKLLQKEFLSGETGAKFANAVNALTKLLRSPEMKQTIALLGDIFSLAVQILTFAINNLPIVLTLLGVNGLARWMFIHVALLTRMRRLMLLIFGGRTIKAIQIMTKGMWAMTKPMLVMYAKALAIIGVILLIQDVLYGLLNWIDPSLGLQSVTGNALSKPKESWHEKEARERSERNRRIKEAWMREGVSIEDPEMRKRRMGFVPMPWVGANVNATQATTNTQTVNISNININGSDSPQATADALVDRLTDLVNAAGANQSGGTSG